MKKKALLLIITIIVNILVFSAILIVYKFFFSRSEYQNTNKVVEYKTNYSVKKYIDTGLNDLHGISSDNGMTYVCGDDKMIIIDENLNITARYDVSPDATAVCACGDRIYIGYKHHVEVYSAAGKLLSSWQNLGNNSLITSLAATSGHVFIADAGNKLVYKFGPEGKLIGMIGKDFVIPSAYFDLAIGENDSLWVTNTGRQKLENYDFAGNKNFSFGVSSEKIDGFGGCCNPANICVNAVGNLITVEKGIIRIKEYERNGKLADIVAGESFFKDHTTGPVFDVASDRKGRVYILDDEKKKVIVFEKTKGQ
jgi:hypothetical protein